ncbi:protein kinase domain-containing protein [Streptomyces sp. NBC_00727]|uniref:protein kinase domain-containing protein n=1 Tax=Streptomyces sp. NBC_00727 TaxID=2903675 RepID=UPI00386FABEF
MGQVYLGESAAGEAVAVKVVKPTVVDSETRQRFAQEIEVLKTVWGPRVAAFVKADTESEQPWLATEYVEGPDLRRLLTSSSTRHRTCGPRTGSCCGRWFLVPPTTSSS